MTPDLPLGRLIVVVVLVLAVVLGTLPVAVAQDRSEVGGNVVVEEGETVDEVNAIGGNVIVDGTVTGDVSAVAGNVYVNGEVGGDVSTLGGNLEIAGTVDGDVGGAAGTVLVAEGATIGGDLGVGAGTITIDGAIEGDTAIGADTITLGETAAIGGDLNYAGDLEGDTAVVAGEVTEEESIGPTAFGISGPGMEIVPPLEPLTTWISTVYTFTLNLVLGAILLAVFPRFSDGVADRVAGDPVRSGLVGLLALVGVPIVLFAIAITIVGIPFSIVGMFAFLLVIWIGIVYGRFAVAAWLLRQVDVDNRWLALVAGLVGAVILGQIPFLGGLLNFVIFLLGLGSLALGVYTHRKRSRETPTDTPAGPAAE
ncbi:cell shape determination protein CcmA [Natrialbaceae archaeon A-gly3]